jgi:hypothetical protein
MTVTLLLFVVTAVLPTLALGVCTVRLFGWKHPDTLVVGILVAAVWLTSLAALVVPAKKFLPTRYVLPDAASLTNKNPKPFTF